MALSFVPIRPVVALTTGAQYNWTDINVRPFGVPDDATGVILHVRNAGLVRNYGLRRNGNTDARNGSSTASTMHTWAVVGIDGNGIFEFYNVGGSPRINLDLIGYTMAGVDFTPSYVNCPELLPVAGGWDTVDLSLFGVPATAIGVIIEVYTTFAQLFGYIQNGSADARLFNISINHPTFGFVIGCDANQIIELFRATNNVRFFLHGFIIDGATFYLNAIDVSPPGVAAWWDLPQLPPHGIMPFIEVSGPGGNFGAREDAVVGISTNSPMANHNFAIPSAFNGNYQGNMGDVATTFHLVGYSRYSPPIVQTDPATEIT